MGYVTGEETRRLLIEAAEREMARDGIDGAKLSAIQQAAGQRNRSAIAHYFGDRDGLVEAIGIKHRNDISPLRHALLDRIERDAAPTVDALAAAIVEPAASKLSSESGRNYLIILAEAVVRRGADELYLALGVPSLDSTRRLNAMLDRIVPGSQAARRLRIGEAVLTATVLLADIARRLNQDTISAAQARRRTRSVTSAVAAMLQAR